MSANVDTGDIELLFWLLAFAALCGAAYLAYLRNFLGTALLIVVAVVAVVIGAD